MRISNVIQKLGISASANNDKQIVVIAGPPGAGKTIVGLRIAHDPEIRKLLPPEIGTPLYLTGNGPLVDVLVESLARDAVNRNGISKPEAKSLADSKVQLIHAITEKKLGIESNVIVFDEGQRVWTAEHMRRKKADQSLASEAEEILSYLERQEWSLVVVLLGVGQEINTGEVGISTWLEAVSNRNEKYDAGWKITTPPIDENLPDNLKVEVNSELMLKVERRTDNAARMSDWVFELLKFNIPEALRIRNTFPDFPLFITRDIEVAKKWLRDKAYSTGGTSGLLASSKSRRLFRYGVDSLASASRDFDWANWHLSTVPDLNSSEALEVAAQEFKCQGLELDWVGMCWSWGFSNKRWCMVSQKVKFFKSPMG